MQHTHPLDDERLRSCCPACDRIAQRENRAEQPVKYYSRGYFPEAKAMQELGEA